MSFPIHLALSRYAPRFHRQEGDVLSFDQEGVSVLKNGEKLKHWKYGELRRLQYFHFPVLLSRSFQFMSGGLFQKRDARFRLEANDTNDEFWLETDLEFRTAELKELFTALYQLGVPLEEFSHSVNRMWLLERAGSEEIESRREALRNGK